MRGDCGDELLSFGCLLSQSLFDGLSDVVDHLKVIKELADVANTLNS